MTGIATNEVAKYGFLSDKISFDEYKGISITTNKQKIEFLINTEQDYCEHAGYLTSEDNLQTAIG